MISGSTVVTDARVWDVNTLKWVAMTQPTVSTDTLTVTLPGTAATAARQDTGNTSLASIDGKTATLVSGRVPIDGSGVTQPVSVSNFPATQAISAASLPLPTSAATEATLAAIKTQTDKLAFTGSLLQTTASIVSGGDGAILDGVNPLVKATVTGANALKVDGSAVTQPISGTVTANAGSGTMAVSGPLTDAQMRASAVPVSGTVTANPATAGGKTLAYIAVNQSAAGTTELAAASAGNRHKLVGGVLTLSAAGTLKFTDGVADLSGPMDVAASGGFVLPTSAYPYMQTGAVNRAINLVTTGGAARGALAVLTEA